MAKILLKMILASRLVHRIALVDRRLALFVSASTRVYPVASRGSSRRAIHVTSSQAQASLEHSSVHNPPIDDVPSSQLPPLKADTHSEWRHPVAGFTAQEASRVISIYTSVQATESDLKVLLERAGLYSAQIFRNYDLETARPQNLCYIKLEDQEGVEAAVAALSRFTLLGLSLAPRKFELETAPPAFLHALHTGWLPSPSSDLTSRVVRPPMTAPPNLLAPLANEQWIVVKRLEVLNPDLKSKNKPAVKAATFDVARNFYTSFHNYDVVGITRPYKHPVQGWCCRILFGIPKDARKAAALWREAYEKKRQGTANVYRGGPDIHKKLVAYQKSLPEDTPAEQIQHLLEIEYRKLRLRRSNTGQQRRLDYPTPESAVGLEENAVTST
ncbi:uncharacterized protein M421DRAFT_225713 [Didymella exigua CBS 183.55]|uniref:RRM domain-containing protein n=1 Tax=Didymella exigua CBS 183.55 TaxID=1150837 RepID=A0A6A5RD16_9PLEO|nr:uncharacterized protein M421DRAFT_225713 [Didymella exigua CBS 183.55]KAF1926145.1 hypothetical protein M421DRAFT_225713 [Didymella exigua CBS 183.55]